jgi:hypothetical protein
VRVASTFESTVIGRARHRLKKKYSTALFACALAAAPASIAGSVWCVVCVCIHRFTYAQILMCMHVCMYTYVCVYVCMHACMHVLIYI